LPISQAVQLAWPFSEYPPAGQDVQFPTTPAVAEKVPASHGLQMSFPS